MSKKEKLFLSLVCLVFLNLIVAAYFMQHYGGLHLIPQADLMASVFWLLLTGFGLLIIIFFQLLFLAESMEENEFLNRRILQLLPKPGKKRESSITKYHARARKKKKAQKEPGKKHKKPVSTTPSAPADGSQAPGEAADQAPQIWKEEDFE